MPSRCIVDRPDTSSPHQIGVIPEKTFHTVHVSNVLRIVDKGRGRMPYPGIGIRVVDIEEYWFTVFVLDDSKNYSCVLVQPVVGRFEVRKQCRMVTMLFTKLSEGSKMLHLFKISERR